MTAAAWFAVHMHGKNKMTWPGMINIRYVDG